MSGRKSSIIFTLLFLPLFLAADTFSFSGDKMETVLAKGRERTVLTGNAQVLSDSNRIQADVIELYGSDFNYIRCEGNVRVVNLENGIDISSDELFYNRLTKVVRVNGNVVMEDKENELVVKGGFLETWEETEETIIQIRVRILKKDLVCRSEFARYLRAEDRLELSGMPVVIWKDDEYRALKIYIDLEADTVRLEGDIRGSVSSGQEEDQEEDQEEEVGKEKEEE